LTELDVHPFELRLAPVGEGAGPERVIRGRVTARPGRRRPYVLLIHGHRGFMDWAFFPELARRIADAGFASVAVNLSGSGIGPDLATFTEREAFARNTYTQELDDLEHVRARIDAEDLGAPSAALDPARGALYGHSRGGGMGLLHAADRGDYRALCLWAPMHRVALFGEESRRAFAERGHILSPLAWAQPLRLDRTILDDAERNARRLDIQAAAARVSAPTLLVYGSRDRLLSGGGAAALERAFTPGVARRRVVEGGGHALGARHPLRDVPTPLEEGLTATVDWFRRHLDPRHG
jgi:dienelactone hydrolase